MAPPGSCVLWNSGHSNRRLFASVEHRRSRACKQCFGTSAAWDLLNLTPRSCEPKQRKRPTNPSRAPAAEAGGQGGRLPWKCGTVGGEYWGLPVALAVAAAP
ncbi:MAG UNVERIFIED_CONTAM: hypothetical protein LVR18_28010 [Planctomycetaceae bacterium]